MKNCILLIAFLLSSCFVKAQINWLDSYALAKEIAKAENKLIVVDCWATWCGPCVAMDDEVWSHKKIQAYANRFVFVKLDLSSGFSNQYFSVKAIPAIFICDAWRAELEKRVGYQSVGRMEDVLKTYCFNVSDIYKDKQNITDKDAKGNLKLAMTYCKTRIGLDLEARRSLKYLSKKYFKNAKKIFKKEGDKIGLNRATILETLNLKAKKRLKILSSLNLQDRENEILKNAIKSKSYFELENKEKAYEYFDKVKTIRLPYYDFLKEERKLFAEFNP